MSFMKSARLLAHVIVTLCLATWPINSAPTSQPATSQPATSPQTTDATDSCYSPISTSPSWLNTSGAWPCPCSSTPFNASCRSSASRSSSSSSRYPAQYFFPTPSVTSLATEAVDRVAEAIGFAENLREEIVKVNMLDAVILAQSLDNETLIEGARNTSSSSTNTTQKVQEQYKKISVALVYLEQSRHDEEPLCGRPKTLVEVYNTLIEKLLRTLCKLKEILNTLRSPAPTVLRSVMPNAQRQLQGEGDQAEKERNRRDYVVVCDVKAILSNAEKVLNGSDWSS